MLGSTGVWGTPPGAHPLDGGREGMASEAFQHYYHGLAAQQPPAHGFQQGAGVKHGREEGSRDVNGFPTGAVAASGRGGEWPKSGDVGSAPVAIGASRAIEAPGRWQHPPQRQFLSAHYAPAGLADGALSLGGGAGCGGSWGRHSSSGMGGGCANTQFSCGGPFRSSSTNESTPSSTPRSLHLSPQPNSQPDPDSSYARQPSVVDLELPSFFDSGDDEDMSDLRDLSGHFLKAIGAEDDDDERLLVFPAHYSPASVAREGADDGSAQLLSWQLNGHAFPMPAAQSVAARLAGKTGQGAAGVAGAPLPQAPDFARAHAAAAAQGGAFALGSGSLISAREPSAQLLPADADPPIEPRASAVAAGALAQQAQTLQATLANGHPAALASPRSEAPSHTSSTSHGSASSAANGRASDLALRAQAEAEAGEGRADTPAALSSDSDAHPASAGAAGSAGAESSGCTVKLRGLPYRASMQDIRAFFERLKIAPNGIRIVANSQGRPSGEACVTFACAQAAQRALKKDRQYMGGRYIEVFLASPSCASSLPASPSSSASASASASPAAAAGTQRAGAAVRAQAEAGAGRHTAAAAAGVAVGAAPAQSAARSAPASVGVAGTKPQTAAAAAASAPAFASASASPRLGAGRGSGTGTGSLQPSGQQQQQSAPALAPAEGPGMAAASPSGREEHSLKMRGLPFKASVADVRAFFGSVGLELDERAVRLGINGQGRPTGEATVVFPTAQALLRAKSKHMQLMGSRYIEIFDVGRGLHSGAPRHGR